MLTRRQTQLLFFIADRQSQGVTPSYEEMMDALGLASKGGIHRLVAALEERGFICRLEGRARAIEIIRMPGESRVPPAPPILPDPLCCPNCGRPVHVSLSIQEEAA